MESLKQIAEQVRAYQSMIGSKKLQGLELENAQAIIFGSAQPLARAYLALLEKNAVLEEGLIGFPFFESFEGKSAYINKLLEKARAIGNEK